MTLALEHDTITPIDARRTRAVIADDTPALRVLFRRILEQSAGAEVVGEAADGRQAINVVASAQPDILFLDLAMPVLDGLDAIPELRRCAPNTRIVLLSGFDSITLEAAMEASGADGFIEKDLDPQSFVERVIETCASSMLAIKVVTTPRVQDDLATFAALAVHDLKSPLQVISGFTGLLDDSYGEVLGESGREYLSWIAQSARTMDTIITDLLRYATIDTTAAPFVEVLLDDTLAAVVVELKEEIEGSKAVLTADALPAVTGDARQLGVVLHQLVSNAIKFVDPDIRPRIHVGATPSIDGWRISVFDNGVGVDPAESTKIFMGLHRLNSRDSFPGTGIGLAICRRIVERHGGALTVERRPGGGSHFYFTLPRQGRGLRPLTG